MCPQMGGEWGGVRSRGAGESLLVFAFACVCVCVCWRRTLGSTDGGWKQRGGGLEEICSSQGSEFVWVVAV